MKIKKVTKKDGSTVYKTQIYLGIDSISYKKVITTVTARTKTELKNKAMQKRLEFEKLGRTHVKKREQKRLEMKGRANPVYFGELLDLWLNTIYIDSVKPSSYSSVKSYIKNYVIPEWQQAPIKTITRASIQKWVNEIATKLVDLKPFSIFKGCMDYAVSLDIIPFNPCNGVIIPKKRKKGLEKKKHFSKDELRTLLDYLDNLNPFDFRNVYDTTFYKLALAIGARVGELVALEWGDIDLNNGTITISKTYDDKNHILSTPKTKKSHRTISIDDKTKKMLKAYKKRQETTYKTDKIKLVFLWSIDYPYPSYSALNKHLHEHLKRAGLPVVGFHAFRHTHATLLVESGLDIKALQYRLGHSKVSTTLDIYTHLTNEKEPQAVALFEKAMNF